VLILRPQHAGGAQGNPGEAAEREPYAQKPRQEARPVDEQGQREEPDSPKGFGGDVLLASQLQKQHRQRVLLRLVEDGQESGSAHDQQRAQVAHHADKEEERRHDAPKDHDEHGEVPVHSREQPVKGQSEEDQDDRAGQVGDDAQTEERLVCRDVVDRGSRVVIHEQLVGDIDEAQGVEEDQEQIPEPGDSSRVLECPHGCIDTHPAAGSSARPQEFDFAEAEDGASPSSASRCRHRSRVVAIGVAMWRFDVA
jgi:hypothetical protein